MGTEKLLCECGWHGTSEELLRAVNPFEPGETIWACPQCKEIQKAVMACDEPGCWKEATCGTPSKNGYRLTCGNHAPIVE